MSIADDPSAGKCVAKKNRCERLGDAECSATGDCILIDSCETRVCDLDDPCCEHSFDQCRADDACTYGGKCKMKKEFNLCASIESIHALS